MKRRSASAVALGLLASCLTWAPACSQTSQRSRRGKTTARKAPRACSRSPAQCPLSESKLRAHDSQCLARAAPSCRELARHFRLPGAQRNPGRAALLLRLSCAFGDRRSCFELRTAGSGDPSSADGAFALKALCGAALWAAPGGPKELRSLVLDCVGGHGVKCTRAARQLSEGKGVAASQAAARRLLRIACAQGHQPACRALSQGHNDPLGAQFERQKLERECRAHGRQSCFELANHYSTGAGGLPRRPQKAHALHRKACGDGLGAACYKLAVAYGFGDKHVRVDLKKYITLLIKACRAGSADACRELYTPTPELRKACREQGIAPSCALLKTRR
ncbi:MAG: tetratricopeptide repeat protein [bacterium]